ncbi:Hypothetical protein, predicted transmembrane protein [Metamycoplasma auris 15026]|uniref:Rho termination factor N-terminal domain-containing protein n=1 Tax=Metamycoplasma auris 15026 TaxID=1188233 RepID=N9VBU7_9BACT|nr:hypothetical protein [Metamycoplasma auris]ENY68896.1 Hypothetical protein, predicted transmembrane protein [Metamycoplasma auris 15026]
MRDIDITKYATPEELYDDQRKRFNMWWILFSTFLGILCILLFSMFIEFALRKEHYILHYTEAISSSQNNGSNAIDFSSQASIFYTRKFAFAIVTVLISLGMFIWHMVSYIFAIKKKDFSKYSPWLSTLYTFIITFVLINFFFSIGSFFNFPSWDLNRILNFVFTIILPIGYFVFYWPCSKIMRMFKYLRAQQQLKELGLNGNPFAMFPTMFDQNNSQTVNNEKMSENSSDATENNPSLTETAAAKPQIDYKSQLETLNDKQLLIMAQKLNIFGASELSRNDLIEKIVLIFQSNDNKKSSDASKNKEISETKSDDQIEQKNEDSKPTSDTEDNNLEPN